VLTLFIIIDLFIISVENAVIDKSNWHHKIALLVLRS